jgi:hypothetical protein
LPFLPKIIKALILATVLSIELIFHLVTVNIVIVADLTYI